LPTQFSENRNHIEMNTETQSPEPASAPSGKKAVGGGLAFLIILGVGMLGALLALFVLELRTPGGILLIMIVSICITLPVIALANRFSAHKALRIDEKIRKEQDLYCRAEAERDRIRKEEREREIARRLSGFHDFGFAHRSMESEFARAVRVDPGTGESPYFPKMVAAALLAPGTPEREAIDRLLPLIRQQEVTDGEIFSFGFSEDLIKRLRKFTAAEFCREVSRALVSELRGLGGPAGDSGSGSEEYIRFEVLLIPDLPVELLLSARKSRMRMEQMVHYQIVPMRDDWMELDTEARPFSLWEQQPSGGWREIKVPYFYAGEGSTVTMGPKFEMGKQRVPFHSAIVDLWTGISDRAMTLSIEDLAAREDFQRRLRIKVQRQLEPYRASQVYQYDRKGYVEVVGWFLDGAWEPWSGKEEERLYLTSMLNVSAPNVLVLPHAASYLVESSEQNKLLANFLSTDLGARRGAVSSQGGNFEIRRGPVTHGSKIHYYFIRLAGNAASTKFLKPAPGAPNQYYEFDAYRDFPAPRPGFSPLEDKGFSHIPASDCYFRTGSASIQLVLRVNLGSPAPGETERGVSYSNGQLQAALRNFAKRQGYSDLEVLEEESAQGLVSRASRQNLETGDSVPVWVKLLDPTHADYFASGRLTETLREASILPGEIEVHRVDTYGRAQAGMIPVFAMPDYLSVADFLLSSRDGEQGEKMEVAASIEARLCFFVKRCLEQKVLCTDFTLADTFFPGTRDERAARSFLGESDCPTRPGLFVGDFGSYRESMAFHRGGSVTREQYRPPEDFDLTLPYGAEAYTVYLLGLLLVETYGFAPGVTLETVMQLRLHLDEAKYEGGLRREVEKVLSGVGESILDQLVAMLAYRPDQRPSLEDLPGMFSRTTAAVATVL
jgi:hypothetical protein